MSLLERIQSDMKDAMKSKDSATLATLRLLRSAIKNKQIDAPEPLSDADVQSIVKTEMKKLKDSLASYEEAGRDENVRSIKREMEVLSAYLPEQLGEDTLTKMVREVIDEQGATSKADFGKVMGAVMQRVKGRADGDRVRNIVESLLGVFVIVAAGQLIATPTHAATLFGVSEARLVEYVFRFVRILFVLAGIVSVNMILRGGFTYMISGRRFDARDSAVKSMTSGVMGTVVIVALFSVVTVALQKMT